MTADTTKDATADAMGKDKPADVVGTETAADDEQSEATDRRRHSPEVAALIEQLRNAPEPDLHDFAEQAKRNAEDSSEPLKEVPRTNLLY